MSGETVTLPVGPQVTARLRMAVPDRDWRGGPNRMDEIELIGISADGASSLRKNLVIVDGATLKHTLTIPTGGIVLRARGRRVSAEGPDLMFYTNPIRIIALEADD